MISSSSTGPPDWKGLKPATALIGVVLLTIVGVGVWYVAFTPTPQVDPPPPSEVEGDPDVPEVEAAQLTAPVIYDLTSVLEQLETAVPERFGDLESREPHGDHDRVEVAYEARRGPLEAGLYGDTARISAIFRYGGRVWYDPPLLPALTAGCGEEEDERPRLRVGLSSRLELDADWILRSRTQVDALEPVTEEEEDQCRITPLQVDVTGTALRGIRETLEDRTGEIDERVASVDIRSRLQEVWHTLERPVELTDDVWLLVNPESVTQGVVVGEGARLEVQVGMTARPIIHLGDEPQVEPSSLPPLDARAALTEDATIRLEGRLHYPAAGRILTQEVRGRELELSRRLIRLESIELSGIGDGRVAMEVAFDGSARGRVYLVGRPELDLDEGEIHVPDLDFDLETRNVLVGGLAWLAQDPMVSFLRERARISLSQVMEPAQEQLHRGMNRELSDEVSVEGEVVSSRLLSVTALREALLVHAEAEARATFHVDHSGS